MEKIKFKDVAHFYLGCKLLPNGGSIDTFTMEVIGLNRSVGEWNGNSHVLLSEVKPILRPLSSMSDEDAIGFCKLSEWESYGQHPHERLYGVYKNPFGKKVVSWGITTNEKRVPEDVSALTHKEFYFLISKHYDVFGLIDSGEAIDGSALEGFKF